MGSASSSRQALLLTLLPLLMATGPGGHASGRAQDPPERATLERALGGDWQGRELLGQLGDHREVEAWSRWEPVLGGAWVEHRYQAWLEGRRVAARLDLYRAEPDGSVRGWEFDRGGAVRPLRGRISGRGMVLKSFDDAGNLLARLTVEWEQGRYELQLETRSGPDEPLLPIREGVFRRTAERKPLRLTEAGRRRAERLPYAPYLGAFEGVERGTGEAPTRASLRTDALLGGAWYRSLYHASLDGAVYHSGIGVVHCSEDGALRMHWFDGSGEHTTMVGKVDERGSVLERRGTDGTALSRVRDVRNESGYTVHAEQRQGPEDAWRVVMRGSYERVGD